MNLIKTTSSLSTATFQDFIVINDVKQDEWQFFQDLISIFNVVAPAGGLPADRLEDWRTVFVPLC